MSTGRTMGPPCSRYMNTTPKPRKRVKGRALSLSVFGTYSNQSALKDEDLGVGHRTVNRSTVRERYSLPGSRIVDGNWGRFGESGKC